MAFFSVCQSNNGQIRWCLNGAFNCAIISVFIGFRNVLVCAGAFFFLSFFFPLSYIKFKCCDFFFFFLNPDKTKTWDLIFIHNRVQFERSLGRCSWNCIFKLHVISWREAGFNLRFLKKTEKAIFSVCLFVCLLD